VVFDPIFSPLHLVGARPVRYSQNKSRREHFSRRKGAAVAFLRAQDDTSSSIRLKCSICG